MATTRWWKRRAGASASSTCCVSTTSVRKRPSCWPNSCQSEAYSCGESLCAKLPRRMERHTLVRPMARGPHILANLPRISTARQPEAMPYEPVCAVFRRYLHGKKLKFTPERAMILDAVLRKQGLFDAEQLVRDVEQLGHE